MRAFVARFRPTTVTRVLDVGGTPFNWTLVRDRPDVVFLNRVVPEGAESGSWVVADARALPFQDQAFDIVYSNSLVEHLGERKEQHLFAEEVRRVGRSYYVQTPDKWFPVETHLLALFIHWLPRRLQKRLWRWCSLRGFLEPQKCPEIMENLHLLSKKQMRRLFPEAEVWRERFFGFCKSIMVVKT